MTTVKKGSSHLKTKLGVISGSMFVGAAANASDIATVQAALIAKVGEAETFGWAILAVSLVATIGIALVKKFGRSAV